MKVLISILMFELVVVVAGVGWLIWDQQEQLLAAQAEQNALLAQIAERLETPPIVTLPEAVTRRETAEPEAQPLRQATEPVIEEHIGPYVAQPQETPPSDEVVAVSHETTVQEVIEPVASPDEPVTVEPIEAVTEVVTEVVTEAVTEAAEAAPVMEEPVEQPSPPQDPAWNTYGPTVELIVAEMLSGRYQEVTDRFAGSFAAAFPPSVAQRAMQRVHEKNGSLVSITDHRRQDRSTLSDGQVAYRVSVHTQNNPEMVVTVTLNKAHQITGLRIK